MHILRAKQQQQQQEQQQATFSLELRQLFKVVEAWHSMIDNDQSEELLNDTTNLKTQWDASSQTEYELCKVYVNKVIDSMIKNQAGFALLAAAETQSDRIMDILLNKNAPVNYRSASGNTALIYVALNGNIDMCNNLINHDADVNGVGMMAADPNKSYTVTPLFSALLNEHVHVMGRLIEAGAKAETGTQSDAVVRTYVGNYLPEHMAMLNGRADHERDLAEPPRKKRVIGND